MKRTATTLALLLFPLAALGGDVLPAPAGAGTIVFKEKLSVSGCGSFKDVGILTFTTNGDSTWQADLLGGELSGTMQPADSKGRKWQLVFDAQSLDDYLDSIEDAATDLCWALVTIDVFEFKKFEVKFDKDFSKIKLKLKSGGTGTSIVGDGKGKHSLKGKGTFAENL